MLQAEAAAVVQNDDEDNFFDLLSRFQSKRMDDQRCSLTSQGSFNKENQCDNAKTDAVANGKLKQSRISFIGIREKLKKNSNGYHLIEFY